MFKSRSNIKESCKLYCQSAIVTHSTVFTKCMHIWYYNKSILYLETCTMQHKKGGGVKKKLEKENSFIKL